jgi:hypothetical protein
LPLRAFALREGLNPYTAWRWKRRLRGGRSIPATSFASVVVERASGAGTAFELVTASGLSLRIPADFDEAALARLVALLGRG